MASTIQNLFPFSTLPANAVTITPVYLEFSAPVQAGKYVFSETTTPAQVIEKIPQGQRAVIAGIQISANCSPDDFAAGVDSPLMLQVLHGGNRTPINYRPFPFAQFSHGDLFTLNWEITAADTSQEDSFLLSVNGKVNQIGNMNSNELVLKVLFNLYRIDANRKW